MKVYRGLSEFEPLERSVVTTGSFDGVHQGHHVVLNMVIERARNIQGDSVILSFSPHPRHVLDPDSGEPKLLNTLDEKIQLLEKIGIDHLIILPFNDEMANMPAQAFIDNILIDGINPTEIIVGYDHRFGKDREGNVNQLRQTGIDRGFKVIETKAKESENITISSTKIRRHLESGNVDKAKHLLSYPYLLTGKVGSGEKIGRQLGFPTANIIEVDRYKLIPADGIYACKVSIDEKTYDAMAYIGDRPSLPDSPEKRIEVNIFDFSSDIYNSKIQLHFYKKNPGG